MHRIHRAFAAAVFATLALAPATHATPPNPNDVVDLVANPQAMKDIVLPKLLDATLINPPESEKANERGRVRLTFVVGTDGLVYDIKITGVSQYWRLNDAAVATVLSRSYDPATRNGKPVAVRIWAIDAFNPDPAAGDGFDVNIDDARDLNLSCRYGTHHVAVDACTAMMDTGKLKPSAGLYPRAHAYEELGDYEKAAADYTRLISYRNDRADLYRNRGFAFEQLGKYDRAVEDYNAALKLDPRNTEFLFDRGFAYDKLGNASRAAEDYQSAMEHRPMCDVAEHRGIGPDWAQGDVIGAPPPGPAPVANPFHETLGGGPGSGLSGGNSDAMTRSGQHVAGGGAANSGGQGTVVVKSAVCKPSWVMALEDIKPIQEGAPDEVQALEYRCWARTVWNKDLDKALADCNRALELHPNFVRAYATRGWLYERKGDLANAIKDSDAALAMNPRLAGALYVRGLAKAKQGDTAAARTDITAARAIDPEIAQTYSRYDVRP
ncbi:MAG TPA: tetratricopeptide repeat protein [Rhizomicrobium sp.]|jgi:TonB family protein|nr:tetratricopeptide repeat protein [Rhizomicrobium sp.]